MKRKRSAFDDKDTYEDGTFISFSPLTVFFFFPFFRIVFDFSFSLVGDLQCLWLRGFKMMLQW